MKFSIEKRTMLMIKSVKTNNGRNRSIKSKKNKNAWGK